MCGGGGGVRRVWGWMKWNGEGIHYVITYSRIGRKAAVHAKSYSTLGEASTFSGEIKTTRARIGAV